MSDSWPASSARIRRGRSDLIDKTLASARGPLDRRARDRLFRPAGLAGTVARIRRPRAGAPGDDRQISGRQKSHARSAGDRTGAVRIRAFARHLAARRGVRQARAQGDAGTEPGGARHPVGLLFRHRQLRSDHAHRRDAALVGRPRRRRAAHHRQHGEVHAGQQRHARSGPAAVLKGSSKARNQPKKRSPRSTRSPTRPKPSTSRASANRRSRPSTN